MLAEHGVDQVAVPVDRPVEVAPSAADLQVGLIDVPTGPRSAPPAMLALAELIPHHGRQLSLTVTNGFMTDLDPAQRHDLA